MKRKIIAIETICMLLLTSLLVGTAIGDNTTETNSLNGLDLNVKIVPAIDERNRQIGLAIKVENCGTETVKGPISGRLNIKSGMLILKTVYTIDYVVLESWEVLNPNVQTGGGIYLPLPGFHINYYEYILDFNDDDKSNNIGAERAVSISFLKYSRMYFL